MSRDDFKITWLKDHKGTPLVPVNAAGKPNGPGPMPRKTFGCRNRRPQSERCLPKPSRPPVGASPYSQSIENRK